MVQVLEAVAGVGLVFTVLGLVAQAGQLAFLLEVVVEVAVGKMVTVLA
jgi:hypothetical protein